MTSPPAAAGGAAPALTGLGVADADDGWSALGFSVEDRRCRIGPLTITFPDDGSGGSGVVTWTMAALDGPVDRPATIDGIPTHWEDPAPAPPTVHPNVITDVDHLVVTSPDLDRTTAAFAAVGADLRRTREIPGPNGTVNQQRFFRFGTIIELVGPAEATGDGTARIWGLALVSPDLDATARALGERMGAVSEAVQPGRRIGTLRTREAGVSVPIAVMSPHVRGR